MGNDPAVKRKQLLVSILSHTQSHPCVPLRHALGHGNDQEVVRFLLNFRETPKWHGGFHGGMSLHSEVIAEDWWYHSTGVYH